LEKITEDYLPVLIKLHQVRNDGQLKTDNRQKKLRALAALPAAGRFVAEKEKK
jgi:hypothetical protein